MRILLAGRNWWRHAYFAGLSVVTGAMILVTAAFFSSAPVREQWAALLWPAPPTAVLDSAKTWPPATLLAEPATRLPAPQGAAQQQAATLPPESEKSDDAPAAPPLPLPTAVATSEVVAQRRLLAEPDSDRHSTLAPAQPEGGRLMIPSLGLSQVVTDVPVVTGQWDVSGLDTGIGLLQTTGKRPGDDLAMAFIGHVSVAWPGKGAFADLILLEHGDEVIYRWQGSDYVYEVERIFLVSPRSVATLYVRDGSRILLATCNDWDYLSWNYAKRLVIQARLVRREPAGQLAQ